MEQEIHAYWQERLRQALAQQDELCSSLRDEVSRLQARCQELSSSNAMGRAAVAFDFHDFAVAHSAMTPNGTMAVPLETIQQFLNAYSDGIVPLDRQGKRTRGRDDNDDVAEAPQQDAQQSRINVPPRTPTVAQLLAARRATPSGDGPAQPQQPQRRPSPQPDPQVPQSPPTCGQQHRFNREAATLVERKRNRGPAMEDEATQLTPWLFSRMP